MYFTEDHHLFRQSLRAFLDKEVMPHIDQWEKQGYVDRSIWKKLGDMGFLGVDYAEEYGGSASDFMYTAILCEEMSKCNSGGFAGVVVGDVALTMPYIRNFANDELKKEYLTKGVAGEIYGCLAITEPNFGSNVAGIKTKAVRDGDYYTVNGSKTYITGGVHSDYIITAVRTGGEGSSGISLLVIDRELEGVSANNLEKMGFHASDTAEIFFDNVKVPATKLIGDENMGFYYIMQNFALERLAMALCWQASCEDAIAYTLQFMNDREAFGRPINKFQVLRHRIAQLASEVERIKIFNYNVARAYGDGEMVTKECAMAKLMATELGDRVMTECLQCFGGAGYMEEYKIARMFRDSRVGRIAGGSSEIMCELIAKMTVDAIDY